MARFRLARPAQIDLADILATSAERWGTDGRQRYAAVLADAMRQVAAEPNGPMTKKRPDLRGGIRSFHVRYARRSADTAKVRRPVHVLYYRVAQEGVIEIIRVLHEKMDPSRHLDELPNRRRHLNRQAEAADLPREAFSKHEVLFPRSLASSMDPYKNADRELLTRPLNLSQTEELT